MPIAEDLAKTESAATLAARIRRKEVSPVEVVDAAIARIEAHNPKINALIIFGYDDARKAAKAAEAAIMRGDAVGPLHGVPIAMKDCFDFKPGWVTTFGGIRALQNYVVDHLLHVRRADGARPARSSSARPTARSSGFRGTCDNYLYGPSKNPFDLTKNTGGSSGGSAGAVAAGLLPLCEGTDGGGSIRIPVLLVRRLSATSPPSGACRSSPGRTPSAAPRPSSSRARSPAPSRTPLWR